MPTQSLFPNCLYPGCPDLCVCGRVTRVFSQETILKEEAHHYLNKKSSCPASPPCRPIEILEPLRPPLSLSGRAGSVAGSVPCRAGGPGSRAGLALPRRTGAPAARAHPAPHPAPPPAAPPAAGGAGMPLGRRWGGSGRRKRCL